MKIGVMVPIGGRAASASYVRTLGLGLEERGFESIWLAEHNVLFDHDEYDSQYPYKEDGRFPGRKDGALLEPLTALSFLAGVTTTLRLGTGILVVPQRNPVFTAKQVADVDVLSGGRMEFGAGVGWLAEEFAAMGAEFGQRGARANEYLEVMQACWTQERSEYHGTFYDLDPCYFNPKPVQKPHPRIHVGGETDVAMRRLARFGRGWYTLNRRPEEFAEAKTRMEPILAARGRAMDEIEISVGTGLTPLDRSDIEAYAEAGVDRIIVEIVAKDESRLLEKLDAMAGSVLAIANDL